jgi:hypothetical protein
MNQNARFSSPHEPYKSLKTTYFTEFEGDFLQFGRSVYSVSSLILAF